MSGKHTTNAFVEIIESHNATVAEVEINIADRHWMVAADAKKHPEDRNDHRIGELYAVGRAMEILGKRMQKLADGYVKEADDVKSGVAQSKNRQNVDFGVDSGFTNPIEVRENLKEVLPDWHERYEHAISVEDNPNQSIL